jgi:hypothetical protein
MNNTIIDRKNLSKINHGVLDLSEKSIEWQDQPIELENMIIVSDTECMRPDLLSFQAYGTDDHWSEICKFNQIANPFSVNIGDVIYCPDLGYFSNQLYKGETRNEQIKKKARRQYYDSSKQTIGNHSIISYQEKVLKKLTPNMQPDGTTEAKEEGGKISLGESY